MARKNPRNPEIAKLVRERGVKTIEDVENLVKELTGNLIQEALDAELEEELGYGKYDYKNKKTANSRNGSYPKTVEGKTGEIAIDVPRDRDGEFEPSIVPKGTKDISRIEEQVLFLYSQGTSTRDIERTMDELYGIEVDASRVSRITDRILPAITEWQNRPLESVYAHVLLDAIHYKVRHEGKVVQKAVYIALGTDADGHRDVLGLWIGETESAAFWMGVLESLRARGVEDVLIFSTDGLTGFDKALEAIFPKSATQLCIVHQVRASTKYLSYKDRKAFCSDLKKIYQADTEDQALAALDELEQIWGEKYPKAVNSWKANWTGISTMFSYPKETRKLIYTTNAIENFNRQLRKVTKTKGAFTSDQSLLKVLYLVTMQTTEKWILPVQNWGIIYNQLSVIFEDRLP